MNKKITIKTNEGKIRYCVLSSEKDIEAGIKLMFFGEENPSGGYSALFEKDKIRIIDSIAFDEVTSFDVTSIEETNEEETKSWVDIK